MAAKRDRTIQTTLAVTVLIFISKAAGLVRDAITASYYGASVESDAYVAAYGLFYLPVLLFNSCITSTLIPMYVEARERGSLKRANRFASNSLNLFAIFSLGVGLLMMLLCGPLVHLVYPGFDPQKIDLTVKLTRIMLPSLIFVVVSIVLSSILNATEHFLAAQLTGFPLTVAVILFTVLFSQSLGIEAMAWGVFAAGILQVVILLPAISGAFRYKLHVNFHDKRFHRLMILAVPSMLSMAVNELNHLIDRSIASGLLTGDITCMDKAYKLITFVTGLIVVPVTTIMFSRMSQKAASHDRKGIIDIVMQCMEVLSMILLPIMAIGSVLSGDIIRAVYEGGRFQSQAVGVTSGVFIFYMIGVLGFGLRDLLNRAFHSMQNTRIPLYMSCVTVALNVVLNLILSRFMGVNGLALATSISCAVGAVLLMVLLRKKLGKMGLKRTFLELIKIVMATALSMLITMFLNDWVPAASGRVAILLRLVGCGGAGLLVFLLASVVLRVRQLSFLHMMLKK